MVGQLGASLYTIIALYKTNMLLEAFLTANWNGASM